MASSSSPSPASSSAKTRPSDTFRPRLPLDPFGDTSHEPWPLRLDAFADLQHRQLVILVLGAPSSKDLSPLLKSSRLANSLLIFATHLQTPISDESTVQPAVHVLRLASPLAIEDAGAVRFVKVLEHAERIARVWRRHGGSGIEHEDLDSDALNSVSVVPPPNRARFSLMNFSVGSKDSLSSSRSRPSSPLPRSATKSRSLPPVDPSQRPFDALFNFLPSSIPEKLLLKQSILVTTISRPFLFDTTPPMSRYTSSRSSSNTNFKRSSSIWANFSRSSFYSSPPTPLYGSRDSLPQAPSPSPSSANNTIAASTPSAAALLQKAHLIHLLPPCSSSEIAREKLIKSMESFLLSFSYPHKLSLAGSSLPRQQQDGDIERAIPYFMPSSVLGKSIPSTAVIDTKYTIADLVVSGALDQQPQPTKEIVSEFGNRMLLPPRAWIPKESIFSSLPITSSTSTPTTPTTTSSLPASSLSLTTSTSLSSSSTLAVPTISVSAPVVNLSVPVVDERQSWSSNLAEYGSIYETDLTTPPPTPPISGGEGAELGSGAAGISGPKPLSQAVKRKRPAKVAGEPRIVDRNAHDDAKGEHEGKGKGEGAGDRRGRDKDKGGGDKKHPPVSFRKSSIPFLSLPRDDSGGGGGGGKKTKQQQQKLKPTKSDPLPPTPPDSDESLPSLSLTSSGGVESSSSSAGEGGGGREGGGELGVEDKRRARTSSFFGKIVDGIGSGSGGAGGESESGGGDEAKSRNRRPSFFGLKRSEGGGGASKDAGEERKRSGSRVRGSGLFGLKRGDGVVESDAGEERKRSGSRVRGPGLFMSKRGDGNASAPDRGEGDGGEERKRGRSVRAGSKSDGAGGEGGGESEGPGSKKGRWKFWAAGDSKDEAGGESAAIAVVVGEVSEAK